MSVSDQRILVTGGRGRLAALLAEHIPAPAEVVRYSREPGGGQRALPEILNPEALAGAHAVLHLAWSSLPAQAQQAPGGAEKYDLPFLARLLESLAAVPAARRPLFVFFSSGGTVYGNAPGRPSREDDPCQPVGEYGRGKAAAEKLIAEQAARHGLATTILRISNPYGYPVPPERRQGLIPHAIRCARTGATLSLWGDGSAQKDFLHYSDFLSAIRAVLAHRLTGTFNVSAGESHSLRDVLAAVEANLGRPIAITRTEHPGWDVQDSRLDNSRLVAATGWRPHITFTEGIRLACHEQD